MIKLVEFDQSLLQLPQETLTIDQEIPVRELMVRSSICRSIMELGQKNINFGVLEKHERRTKTILIRNNSEFPLVYSIKKSGSISSGDLLITNGKNGIIRGFGKREIAFLFDPSLSGLFNERLIVENVYDPSNSQVITIKANVKKASHFDVSDSQILNFGVCMINELASTNQQIQVSNTNTRYVRIMEVSTNLHELETQGFDGEIIFEMLEADETDDALTRKKRPMKILSRDMEEQIEQLEQKMKIARRKGRKDKLKKISDKIERITMGLTGEDYQLDQVDSSSNPVPMERYQSSLSQQRESSLRRSESSTAYLHMKTKKLPNAIVFSISPRSIRTVVISLKPRMTKEIVCILI